MGAHARVRAVRRFVLDTNVLVAALRSPHGASFALLSALPLTGWELVLSVPLYLEWQDVLLRAGMVRATFTRADIMALCRYLASIAAPQDIHYRWPAFLPDPKDDMVLELAVAAGSAHVVTHNLRHFPPAATGSFGVHALAPDPFLRLVGLRP